MNDSQSLLGGKNLDNKKELITHSAIKAFQAKGIDKTTVSDIVKGAGIAQGTFYLYFPSKLSVMPAIAEVMVNKIRERFKAQVDLSQSFEKQLEQFIEMKFQVTKEYKDIFALIYAGMASTEHLNEWEAIYAPYYKRVGQMLKTAQKNDEIIQSIEAENYAILLIGLIESAAEQAFLYAPENDLQTKLKKQEVLNFTLLALKAT